MAEGWSAAAANSAIDALVAAYPYMKMHTGAPGAAGTSNAAGETTRKLTTFAGAAAGSAAFSVAVTWTAVSTSETWTKCSFWSAVSGGSFGFSGTITANALTAGDDATIAIAGYTVSVTLAS